MKDGLLDRIESVGHWRVNFRPLAPLQQPLSFQECSDLVRENAVLIRGWDYPHFPKRQDDAGGGLRGENFYEGWCDWWGHQEFWRMYRSGQFLSYNALREDSSQDEDGRRRGTLSIISAIYSMTEFVEFAHRLHLAGPYREGVIVMIALRNTAGRYLDTGPSRVPFFDRKETGAENISFERTLDASQIRDQHQSIALDLTMELFDFFGWNPAREQIAADQARFYRRDF
jgi:hypothetical protein